MTHTGATPTRLDIQVLRGLAVLWVVLYHAKLSAVPSGFLGVDVFFVISGYLITSQIAAGLRRGDFSFGQFYFRRARRLLPAAYVTLAASWLVAPWLLGPSELADLRAQVWGAVTFTANLVLWKQSGYFQGASELKPLLHFWSLAVEEQYYLFLPLFLAMLPKRWWLPAIGAALVLSLGVCLAMLGRDVAFYLLPFRAWEMLFGSVVALSAGHARTRALIERLAQWLFWPSLAVLVGLPLVPSLGSHPGWAALLVCVATTLVIARAHPTQFKTRALRPMVKLGDWSYSLYLVHWPLFALANNVWLQDGATPLSLRQGLLALALLLAWLLHHTVELPVQRLQWPSRRVLAPILASSAALVIVPLWPLGATAAVPPERLANRGLDAQCDYQTPYQPIASCQTGQQPDTLVWGDSFAMHLVPGLATGKAVLAQATRAVCGPLLGLAVIREQERNRGLDWSRHCIEFNNSVLEHLRRSPHIRLVILSSPFDQFTNPIEHQVLWDGHGGALQVAPASVQGALDGLSRTVQAVRALGKTVVVVAPPPMGGFDAGRCHERLRLGLPVAGVAPDCSIPQAWYHDKRASVLQFLDAVPRVAQVALIRFDPLLCDEAQCRTVMEGVALYRDGGHLSRAGSVLLAGKMALLDTARSEAR